MTKKRNNDLILKYAVATMRSMRVSKSRNVCFFDVPVACIFVTLTFPHPLFQQRCFMKAVQHFILLAAVLFCFGSPFAVGEIIPTGEVFPSAPSDWGDISELFVGDSGTGTLTINDGGMVTSGYATIGSRRNSNGTVTVTGKDSTWNSKYPTIGDRGNGTLNIDEGAIVNSVESIIGSVANSTGIVTVSNGSVWNNSSELYVGDGGTGTLNINNGKVWSNVGNVGTQARSSGVVNVFGDKAIWDNNSLIVGEFDGGNGTLNIGDGGLVEAVWYIQGDYGYLHFALANLFAETILAIKMDADFRFAPDGSVSFDFTNLVLSGEDDVFVGITWDGDAYGIRDELFNFGTWNNIDLTGWSMSRVWDIGEDGSGQIGWQFTRLSDPEPPSTVPEPATLLMLGLGLGAIPLARRLRKK